MRIAMMGSGGVGGFFGGRLAAAGYDVSFIARGAHLEAMRRDGLTIENDAQGPIRIPKVNATDDPASAGPVDFVILSVKLWVCYVATQIARPGVIKQVGTMQRIVIGEYDGRPSERAKALHQALQNSGVSAELSRDVRRAIWEKYVFLVGLSATTASMRSTIGPIRGNPRTRAFLLELMREVVNVGRACGVELPVDYAEQRLQFADGLPADMTSSMAHDLERGNRLEVNWRGAARQGARHHHARK